MRLDTHSGTHGELVAYVQQGVADNGGTYGFAVVKQDQPAYAARPYSTHHVEFTPEGQAYAFSGNYDQTLIDALSDVSDVVLNTVRKESERKALWTSHPTVKAV